jgi:hypothetical protein
MDDKNVLKLDVSAGPDAEGLQPGIGQASEMNATKEQTEVRFDWESDL